MNVKQHREELKPFVSVVIVILSLFLMVFLKMEARRMGYNVLKLSREFKVVEQNKRKKQMKLAKLVRPERIETYAQKYLSLKKANKGQIIQITGNRIVLRH